MIRPKYPPQDTYTAPAPTTAAPVVPADRTPAAVPAPLPAPARPVVHLHPGALVAVAAGGTAAVLVVGTVLVSLLLAVAVTATSVAVCAVVLRSLLNQHHSH